MLRASQGPALLDVPPVPLQLQKREVVGEQDRVEIEALDARRCMSRSACRARSRRCLTRPSSRAAPGPPPRRPGRARSPTRRVDQVVQLDQVHRVDAEPSSDPSSSGRAPRRSARRSWWRGKTARGRSSRGRPAAPRRRSSGVIEWLTPNSSSIARASPPWPGDLAQRRRSEDHPTAQMARPSERNALDHPSSLEPDPLEHLRQERLVRSCAGW